MSTQINAFQTADGHIKSDFTTRQEQARRACEAAGIEWPGTILPEGTALYNVGVEKLKSDRKKWMRLPLASEVIGLVEAALESQKRLDIPMPVDMLRFRPSDGRLVRKDHVNEDNPEFGLGYGDHTLRQLIQQIDPLDNSPRGFASAMLYLKDSERAMVLNKRLDQMSAEKKDDTLVTLRTRLAHNHDKIRIVRAALSERYGSITDHDIAAGIGFMLGRAGDKTGRLDYKPGDSLSRFEVIWPSEIPVKTFVVGDVHYGMLSITNSETGQGSLTINAAVVRAACANLTLSVGKGVEINIRHIGDKEKLAARFAKAIEMALADLQPLLSVITESNDITLGTFSPEKAFAAVAKKYQLAATQAVPMWKAQLEASNYPQTVWGLSAAISEAAHKRDDWAAEAEWERVASDIQDKAVKVLRQGGTKATSFAKALDIEAVVV